MRQGGGATEKMLQNVSLPIIIPNLSLFKTQQILDKYPKPRGVGELKPMIGARRCVYQGRRLRYCYTRKTQIRYD